MSEIKKKSNRALPAEAPIIINKNLKRIPGKNKIGVIKYTRKKNEKTLKRTASSTLKGRNLQVSRKIKK